MLTQSDLFGLSQPAVQLLASRFTGGWLSAQFCGAVHLHRWIAVNGEQTYVWIHDIETGGQPRFMAQFSRASSARLRAVPARFGETKEAAALALVIAEREFPCMPKTEGAL